MLQSVPDLGEMLLAVMLQVCMQESMGSLSSEDCRVVRAGISGVSLQWLPKAEGQEAHVFAVADQAVMIRQRQPIHNCKHFSRANALL